MCGWMLWFLTHFSCASWNRMALTFVVLNFLLLQMDLNIETSIKLNK